MRPQEIAYVIFRTRENTGTKVVFDHVQALRLLGHNVTVYTLFGSKASWYPKGMTTNSILHLFSAAKPDALVATFWPSAYVVSLLPAKRKFYLVMGWEEAFHTISVLRFFARQSYKLPIQKITVSRYLKERIEVFIKRKESVLSVKTCIPDFIFPKKQKMKSKKGNFTILSVVSWYNRVKGIDLLEKAVRQFKKQGNQYTFVLVSREEKSYSSVFDQFYSNPPKKVLQQLYKDADVLLATSRSEGFYIPGIEGMANGCLFITTNSGGVTEYAENEENAIILKNVSDLWKKQVIQKLATNEKLRKKLISNGYKTAAAYRKYSLKHLGKDLEKIMFG